VESGPAEEEMLLYADVDLDAIDRARSRHSYLEDRRPALYRD
jgi:predicted amidohydrolase